MKVTCDHCGASGEIDETRIPAGALSINCPRCNQKFPIPAVNEAVPSQPLASEPVERVEPAPPPPITPQPSAPPVEAYGSPTSTCTVCHQQLPQDEMVRFGTSWVCADCKPGYVQRLAQGKPAPGLLRYAGFGVRFGAKFLDGLILGVASFLVTTVVGMVMPSLAHGSQLLVGAAALNFLLQTAIAACYSGYFLSKHQATPGKMACGLKVINPDGEEVSFLRGAGRYFGELLSSATLSIGYLMVLFDSEKRALHDRICNTRVVYR